MGYSFRRSFGAVGMGRRMEGRESKPGIPATRRRDAQDKSYRMAWNRRNSKTGQRLRILRNPTTFP